MSKFSPEDWKALVLLNRLAQDRRPFLSLLREGAAPSEILLRVREENLLGKSRALGELLASFDPERELETCEAKGIQLLSLEDEMYPPLLKQVADPPILLYLKGDLWESDEAAVAVVGSRHPNIYGSQQTGIFSRSLAGAGLTIVSGFAVGVDRAAHEAALSVSYGRTLAVMGCGLDVDYPKNSRDLFDQIIEKGAVLSEYGLGTYPFAENFPRRNRIIAGLALGVLVIQANRRSGSLITARLAAEEGREVFALPGPVDQPHSEGTHALIKEGASLVESPEDILQALALPLSEKVRAVSPAKSDLKEPAGSLNGDEESVLNILQKERLTYDEIASRCRLQTPAMSAILMGLELKRKVRKHPDGKFAAFKA